MSTQATARRRKVKSRSPYPSGCVAIPPTKKKKPKKKSHGKYKSDSDTETKNDSKIIKYPNIKKNNKIKRTKVDLNSKFKDHYICLTPLQVIILTIIVFTVIIFCAMVIWNEYSKRLEMEFQLQKYNHEAEMTKIALERARIDAELEKLQQNLKYVSFVPSHLTLLM